MQSTFPWLNVNLVSFEDSAVQKKTLDRLNIRLPAFYIRDSSRFDVPEVLPRTLILRDNIVIRDIYTAKDWMGKEIREIIDTLTPQGRK